MLRTFASSIPLKNYKPTSRIARGIFEEAKRRADLAVINDNFLNML
jgi:hypothetical protein